MATPTAAQTSGPSSGQTGGSRVRTWALEYAVAVVALCAIDLVWLTTVAQQLYADQLGDLLRDPANAGAAAGFYALYVVALIHFVIEPAVHARSWRRALFSGAFLGLVCYATWDLTNLAVIQGFPGTLVPIDMAWGTVLTGLVCLASYAVTVRVTARR